MDEKNSEIGIIKELGDLPADAVISEEALAKIFCRHKVSVKRAVERGELPPSVRLFGVPVWTVRALREHLSKRLEAAKKEAEKLQRRISENRVRAVDIKGSSSTRRARNGTSQARRSAKRPCVWLRS